MLFVFMSGFSIGKLKREPVLPIALVHRLCDWRWCVWIETVNKVAKVVDDCDQCLDEYASKNVVDHCGFPSVGADSVS